MRPALHSHGMRRVPRRLAARYHPPHHRAHAVHVGPRSELARICNLLHGRVSLRIRSHRLALICHDLLRGPKIDQHGATIDFPNEDVGGLDVTVQQSRFMHALQALQQRHDHAKQVGLTERPALGFSRHEHLGQRAAVLKLHHHVRRSVRPEEVPARNHAGIVLKLHQRPRLVPEASQAILEMATVGHASDPHVRAFPHGQFNRQVLLDGHGRAEFVVMRPIDDAESAVPDHRLEGVLTQGGARGEGISSRWINRGHRSYGCKRCSELGWSGRSRASQISVFRSRVDLAGPRTFWAAAPVRDTA